MIRRGRSALGVVGVVVAAGLALSGCSSDAPGATGSRSLSCEDVLPITDAARVLGVPASSLSGSITTGTTPSIETQRSGAEGDGGLLDCGWYEEGGTTYAHVSVLQDASGDDATAIAQAPEGILRDGDPTLRCDGDGSECTADSLEGSTWVSVRMRSRTLDAAAFTTAVDTAIAATRDTRTRRTVLAEAPVTCGRVATTLGEHLPALGLADGTLLAPADMPTATRTLAATDTGSIGRAAADRAGLIECVIVSEDGTRSIEVSASPGATDAWTRFSLDSSLAVPVEPVADIGSRAMAGCDDTSCEIDAEAGGVWWRVAVVTEPVLGPTIADPDSASSSGSSSDSSSGSSTTDPNGLGAGLPVRGADDPRMPALVDAARALIAAS